MLGLSVAAQVDLALEPLLAETAGKGFVAGVLPHVRDEVAALGKGFAAHHTFVRLLS